MLDISLFAVLSCHHDFGRFPSAIIAARIFADPKNPTVLPDVQGRGAVADRAASSSAAGPRGGGTTEPENLSMSLHPAASAWRGGGQLGGALGPGGVAPPGQPLQPRSRRPPPWPAWLEEYRSGSPTLIDRLCTPQNVCALAPA